MTLPEHGQYEQYSYPDEQPAKPEGKELGFWLITFDCDVDVDVGALGAPFLCHLLHCLANCDLNFRCRLVIFSTPSHTKNLFADISTAGPSFEELNDISLFG